LNILVKFGKKVGLVMKTSYSIGKIYVGVGTEQETGRYLDLGNAFIFFVLISALHPKGGKMKLIAGTFDKKGGTNLSVMMWPDKTKLRIEADWSGTKAEEIFKTLEENKDEDK
jgi:uncharacterized protein YwbE